MSARACFTETPVAPRARLGDLAGLVLFVALCLAIGALGASLTAASVETWYADLAKPSFNPPNEVFGPVAPVVRFSTLDEVVNLASGTEYGLSLGILTRDVMKGLELAERIPSGLVHINDQTVNDEAVAPFGGVASSGTGSRFGGAEWNIEAFTETQWVTVRGQIAPRRL